MSRGRDQPGGWRAVLRGGREEGPRLREGQGECRNWDVKFHFTVAETEAGKGKGLVFSCHGRCGGLPQTERRTARRLHSPAVREPGGQEGGVSRATRPPGSGEEPVPCPVRLPARSRTTPPSARLHAAAFSAPRALRSASVC